VSDPTIIGTIEDVQLKNPVRLRPDVLKFKQLNSNNTWL